MTSTSSSRRVRSSALTALAAAGAMVLAACGGSGQAAAGGDGGDGAADELRLGYFANVTHAAALVGLDQGFVAEELGDTTLSTQVFNAGPAAIEAVFGGALDASYIGPNPAINAFGQSDGEAVRLVAGATSGGAQLVVRDGISGPEDLRGTTLATPQLGNTQDVALRAWLDDNGLENSVDGGGDVTISPTPNADTLQLFQAGQLDGAWLPEPWASRLVLEAGAEVLLDEAELWPEGRFVTTHLLVRTEFLEEYPETVEALLRAHVRAVDFANESPDEAKEVVNGSIDELTGEPLPQDVLDRAWDALEITVDPVATSLATSAEDAFSTGVAEEDVDLDGIYDLRLLNGLLADEGRETVSAGGLGQE